MSKELILKSLDEFKDYVMSCVKDCPKNWRKGQSVFNVIDEMSGIAREVQFVDGIDCFYNDDNIDEFITHAYYYYQQYIIKENEKLK